VLQDTPHWVRFQTIDDRLRPNLWFYTFIDASWQYTLHCTEALHHTKGRDQMWPRQTVIYSLLELLEFFHCGFGLLSSPTSVHISLGHSSPHTFNDQKQHRTVLRLSNKSSPFDSRHMDVWHGSVVRPEVSFILCWCIIESLYEIHYGTLSRRVKDRTCDREHQTPRSFWSVYWFDKCD
jgi:hypothetical protein